MFFVPLGLAAVPAVIGFARSVREPQPHPVFYWLCAAVFGALLWSAAGIVLVEAISERTP